MNGEGGLLSDTKWTVVKQHDARWWDFGVIPSNIPPNKNWTVFNSMDTTGSITFVISSHWMVFESSWSILNQIKNGEGVIQNKREKNEQNGLGRDKEGERLSIKPPQKPLHRKMLLKSTNQPNLTKEIEDPNSLL